MLPARAGGFSSGQVASAKRCSEGSEPGREGCSEVLVIPQPNAGGEREVGDGGWGGRKGEEGGGWGRGRIKRLQERRGQSCACPSPAGSPACGTDACKSLLPAEPHLGRDEASPA